MSALISKKFVETLSEDKQFSLAVKLIRLMLPIWDNYASENKLSYRDTVVGLTHTVDKSLLLKIVDSVEQCILSKTLDNKTVELGKQFLDPIVALQDLDWDLPEKIKQTFYSVYNLLSACSGKVMTASGDLTIHVSINQAVSALSLSGWLTSGEIVSLLSQ